MPLIQEGQKMLLIQKPKTNPAIIIIETAGKERRQLIKKSTILNCSLTCITTQSRMITPATTASYGHPQIKTKIFLKQMFRQLLVWYEGKIQMNVQAVLDQDRIGTRLRRNRNGGNLTSHGVIKERSQEQSKLNNAIKQTPLSNASLINHNFHFKDITEQRCLYERVEFQQFKNCNNAEALSAIASSSKDKPSPTRMQSFPVTKTGPDADIPVDVIKKHSNPNIKVSYATVNEPKFKGQYIIKETERFIYTQQTSTSNPKTSTFMRSNGLYGQKKSIDNNTSRPSSLNQSRYCCTKTIKRQNKNEFLHFAFVPFSTDSKVMSSRGSDSSQLNAFVKIFSRSSPRVLLLENVNNHNLFLVQSEQFVYMKCVVSGQIQISTDQFVASHLDTLCTERL